MWKRQRRGKRERVARKQRRRGSITFYDPSKAEWITLKLGAKKSSSFHLKRFQSVGG